MREEIVVRPGALSKLVLAFFENAITSCKGVDILWPALLVVGLKRLILGLWHNLWLRFVVLYG